MNRPPNKLSVSYYKGDKMLPKYMTSVVNIKNTNIQQYEWLYSHTCEHRHRFTRHFNCFLTEYGIEERIGFLDIETSNLKANFGIVLAWCILDKDGKKLYSTYITAYDIASGDEDKRLIETCIAFMKTYDRLCGHYSTFFDIPFLRTRALIHKLSFPEQGTIYHTDVWKMAKKSLCLHSNRQNVIAESLYGKTEKTRISHPAWRQAMMGNEAASLTVLDHCKADVRELRRNFYTLLPFNRLTKTSI